MCQIFFNSFFILVPFKNQAHIIAHPKRTCKKAPLARRDGIEPPLLGLESNALPLCKRPIILVLQTGFEPVTNGL